MLASDRPRPLDRSESSGPALGDTVGSVVMLTPRWARDGGVGAHVRASAEALARTGIRVQVVTTRIEAGDDIDGVAVHESAELFNPAASLERRLAGPLDPAPDIVHLHQVDDARIVEQVRPTAPAVISAHGYTACPSGVYYFRPGEECTRGHGPGCIPNLLARGCAHTR